MPRYSYRCEKCEKQFTVFHSIKERATGCADVDCDKEHTENLEKILSEFSISKIGGLPPKEKTGGVVKKHIEETKKETTEQKRISRKEFKVT
tara:strand:+ start:345 stop:620 length:276 start_codon:yes stop_codon:yes gene_type:complete